MPRGICAAREQPFARSPLAIGAVRAPRGSGAMGAGAGSAEFQVKTDQANNEKRCWRGGETERKKMMPPALQSHPCCRHNLVLQRGFSWGLWLDPPGKGRPPGPGPCADPSPQSPRAVSGTPRAALGRCSGSSQTPQAISSAGAPGRADGSRDAPAAGAAMRRSGGAARRSCSLFSEGIQRKAASHGALLHAWLGLVGGGRSRACRIPGQSIFHAAGRRVRSAVASAPA